jgi:hypothetical protein
MASREFGKVKRLSKGVESDSPDTILSLPLERVILVDGDGDNGDSRTQDPAGSEFTTL